MSRKRSLEACLEFCTLKCKLSKLTKTGGVLKLLKDRVEAAHELFKRTTLFLRAFRLERKSCSPWNQTYQREGGRGLLFAHSFCFGLTATSARSGKQLMPIPHQSVFRGEICSPSSSMRCHPCALPSPIPTHCKISCPQTFFWPPCAPCNLCQCLSVKFAMTWDVAPSCGHEPQFESRFLSFHQQAHLKMQLFFRS